MSLRSTCGRRCSRPNAATRSIAARTPTGTSLGALVAYNAVVEALRRARLDDRSRARAARLRAGRGRRSGAAAGALPAIVTDEDADIDLSPYGPPPATAGPFETQFESGGDLIETGRDGPTVLVIGDSFTRGFWQDYFALHAERYVWMHHEQCGFKPSVIEHYAPDIVILAPTERQMFCH